MFELSVVMKFIPYSIGTSVNKQMLISSQFHLIGNRFLRVV